MEISEKELDVINDLIKINNDRAAGFEKAGTDLEGGDNALIYTFTRLAGESQSNIAELTGVIQVSGAEAADGTSTSGDLHRAWIDIKAAFTGHDLLSILNECERGEDAAKAAYRDALDPENELSFEIRDVLQRQQEDITAGHALIRGLRDQAEATENNADDIEEYGEQDESEEDKGKKTEPGFPLLDSVATAKGETAVYKPEFTDETTVSTSSSKLMEFFVDELQDLLWAERELVDTLPAMAEAATSAELKAAFEMHLTETGTHVSRLEEIFGILGLEPESRKCEAMAGILAEGEDIIDATEDGTAQRDVGLIFAGQKAEHYEIASYGGMIALAKTLGYYEVAELLVLTLDEEKTADAKLTEIAESQANYEASTEPAAE